MDNRERKQKFLVMGEHEKIYKKLYEENPDIYFYDKKGKQYRDWDEFKAAYQLSSCRKIIMPKEAPTIINYVLRESDFFMQEDRDVDIVMNARFCPPFWHHLSFVKIMYVLNGEFLLNTGLNRTIKLQKGNFVVVPPDLKQSVFSYHEEDIVINIFLRLSTFEKTFASLLMDAEELSTFFWKMLYGKDESSIILFRCETDEFLEKLILDMYDEKNAPRKGCNFLLVSYVMAFLAYALSRYLTCMTSIVDTQLRKDKFSSVIQYIRENYNTVTLSSLAECFHKSEGYLSRYIKQETGYSLTHLLKEFRMRQAALMLRETRCSVEEIMLKVGYTDISYFYKAFKEIYGMTPKGYREQDKIIRL